MGSTKSWPKNKTCIREKWRRPFTLNRKPIPWTETWGTTGVLPDHPAETWAVSHDTNAWPRSTDSGSKMAQVSNNMLRCKHISYRIPLGSWERFWCHFAVEEVGGSSEPASGRQQELGEAAGSLAGRQEVSGPYEWTRPLTHRLLSEVCPKQASERRPGKQCMLKQCHLQLSTESAAVCEYKPPQDLEDVIY